LETRPRLLEFIHLHSFDQTAEELLDDDDLRLIQQALIERPLTGAVVEGTGGLRKLRISVPGRGKRGGARLLYLYVEIRTVIYLVIVYTKRKQADLTIADYRVLAELVKRLKREK
jgi:mRNA-degrading endonuclease RelE of RelBE toxin-antitoxin system